MLLTFKKPFAVLLLFTCLGGCQVSAPVKNDPPIAEVPAYSPATPNIPTGPALYCKVGHGIGVFDRGWHDFADTTFTLYANERANITLSRLDRHGVLTVQGFFDSPGQKLIFCPYVDGPPQQRIACTSIYALEDDLQTGIKRTFDIPNMVRSGAITCAYDQKNLQTLTGLPTGGEH